MADLTGMTEIVRHRFETGEYGNAHFKMPRSLWDEMCAAAPPMAPEPAWRRALSSPLGDLLAIPVVVDDTLPPGTWRLVDSSTREILYEGRSE